MKLMAKYFIPANIELDREGNRSGLTEADQINEQTEGHVKPIK